MDPSNARCPPPRTILYQEWVDHIKVQPVLDEGPIDTDPETEARFPLEVKVEHRHRIVVRLQGRAQLLGEKRVAEDLVAEDDAGVVIIGGEEDAATEKLGLRCPGVYVLLLVCMNMLKEVESPWFWADN